jgi:hypothetical protein
MKIKSIGKRTVMPRSGRNLVSRRVGLPARRNLLPCGRGMEISQFLGDRYVSSVRQDAHTLRQAEMPDATIRVKRRASFTDSLETARQQTLGSASPSRVDSQIPKTAASQTSGLVLQKPDSANLQTEHFENLQTDLSWQIADSAPALWEVERQK